MIRVGTHMRQYGAPAAPPNLSPVLKYGTGSHVVTPTGVGVLAAVAVAALCVSILRLPKV